jgi:hypothetical protein
VLEEFAASIFIVMNYIQLNTGMIREEEVGWLFRQIARDVAHQNHRKRRGNVSFIMPVLRVRAWGQPE